MILNIQKCWVKDNLTDLFKPRWSIEGLESKTIAFLDHTETPELKHLVDITEDHKYFVLEKDLITHYDKPYRRLILEEYNNFLQPSDAIKFLPYNNGYWIGCNSWDHEWHDGSYAVPLDFIFTNRHRKNG